MWTGSLGYWCYNIPKSKSRYYKEQELQELKNGIYDNKNGDNGDLSLFNFFDTNICVNYTNLENK